MLQETRPRSKKTLATPSHSVLSSDIKMINNKWILLIMLSIFANVSMGQPEEPEDHKDKEDKLFINLPFLQLGNGGVRVTFAGYHAEAGLGGLLGGSGTRGGLYAGAGTPFGAHASADLGGALGGDKTGGGLRARAGLGNGLPEAVAGLGGNLDGSNEANNNGRLYAGASDGLKTRIVTKDIGVANIDQSNIQVIPKKTHDVSQTSATASDANPEVGVIRRDAYTQDDRVNAVEPIPVAVVTDSPHYINPTRRCRRKRLCSNFARKTLGYQQYIGNQLTPDLGLDKPLPGLDATIVVAKRTPEVSAEAGVSGGIATDSTGHKDVPIAPGPAPAGPPPPPYPVRRTFFDEIFNIPIATLTAVNQLLNSKVG